MSEEMHLPLVLEKYALNAMTKAHYQVLEDGTYYSAIFLCPGVWAIGDSLEECQDALRESLDDWLIAAYEGRDPVPSVTELAWLNPRWHRAGD